MDTERPEEPAGLEDAAAALAKIGVTLDELEQADEELYRSGRVKRRSRDTRICACGHRMSAHTIVGGASFCRPTKLECPCKTPRAVLNAQDTRCFNYKTEGSGGLHALSRGLLASARRSKRVEWLVDLVCDRCGKSAERLTPTAVTQRGVAVPGATGFDALLCEDCRRDV